MNYIANTQQQQKEMLQRCGISSIQELFNDIPKQLQPKSFNIPKGMSELEMQNHIEKLAGNNVSSTTSFLGGGFYDHFIPSAVDAISSRSEFYTAYTPYQPELSQGTLQAIYEYQTDICRLTDLEVSNASLYDGGTALFEACQMAVSATDRKMIVVDQGVNPIYRSMLSTYTRNLGITIKEIPLVDHCCDRHAIHAMLGQEVGCVVIQNPNFFGIIDEFSDLATACHAVGALIVQVTNPISCALLKTPGAVGIDIAVGDGQSLGLPLSFGGPYLGFMATTKKLVRKMPGRLVGRTTDAHDREGFVLTLQAREQHIRREKATSNICSNQALCALRAHIYLSLLGTQGLRETAQLCFDKSNYLKQRLARIPSVTPFTTAPTFNEFLVKMPQKADTVIEWMTGKGFAAGYPVGHHYKNMDNYLLVAVTEKRTKDELDHYAETLEYCLCH